MKISIFLMCISIGVVSANTTYSQNTMFTLHVNNKALKDVFTEIEKQSEYIFFYNDEAVNINEKVDFSVDNATIYEILDKVLDKKNSGYKVVDRQVILFKNSESSDVATQENDAIEQANYRVTGSVVSDTGEPLVGVSVMEKGTTNGAITNIDGNYTVFVRSENSVLQFSYIGFETKEIAVAGKNTINVTLEEELSSLDEVVVVGYGTQRKSSITGSIATVNVEKMKDITSPSVANMLQGKVAGVSVIPTSGQPGAGVTIRVRGLGTIQGNKEPLWVIDGVVGDAIADLNPNDIEAISILKDGSATALYGSRGSNGVVLVTTKRGTVGTSQVEVSARLGVSNLQKGNLRMMNGAEYYDYLVTAFTNAGTLEDQHYLQPYLRNQNTNWWDISTQSALTQNYNIGYRFGNDKIRSYISGDYYAEEGTIKGYNLDRFTLRVNTDYVINNRLTLKAKLSNSYRQTHSQEHSLSYTSYTPWDTPYDSQGNLKSGSQGTPSAADAPTADPRDYWYSDGSSNFLYDRHLNWSKTRRNAMDIGLGFDYKIFDYLTFESNNKVGFGNSYGESYTDPTSRSGQAKNGTIYNSNSNNRAIYTNQMFRLLKTINEVHEINAFLGYEYDERFSWSNTGESSDMLPGNQVLSGGADSHKVTGSKSEAKNAAYIFNGNYAYDGKYLFQLMFRRDGSSRFGANKKWANFWSIGAGWNMHQENFISQFGFIDELKPRISYGISGNQPTGAYEWTTKFNSTAEYGGKVSLMTNYAGNPNLSWEETKSIDVGLDMRLFNRVSVTFDYYTRKTDNLLYLRHLAAVVGFNRQTANDGSMENKGYEITITPEIIKTKDMYWDISFNLGYNKSKITYLPDGDDLAFQAVAVGYPYLNFYMREWAGVDTMTGDPLWFKIDSETGEKTVTNIYNEATAVLLDASPTPKYNGGINTSFAWKGFSLNASFTFSAGAKIYNGQRAGALDRDAERPSQPAMKLAKGWSRWEKPGDIATHPRLVAGGNNSASSQSTRYLENGDFFKMKSISLSYNVPRAWLKTTGFRDATITLGGENLFTITKYSGYDPEVLLSSNFNGTTTASSGQLYPTVRRFTLGVNLKF